MFSFVAGNIGTIIITLLLLCIVAAVIIVIRRDKKKGKCSCGGNCGHCPMDGACHKQ